MTQCNFSKSHVQLDSKEQTKLDKITNESGHIKKEDFAEFAKKSAAVKDFGLRTSVRSSTSTPPIQRKEIDKAEVVFRVRNIMCSGFTKNCDTFPDVETKTLEIKI